MKFKVGDKVIWVDISRYGNNVLTVVDVLTEHGGEFVLVEGDVVDKDRGRYLYSYYFRKLTPLELAMK